MLRSLIIGFLPWIFYFTFIGPEQAQINAAIVIALVSFLFSGISSLMKGFILNWVTLLFFTFMLVTVVWLENDWIAQHALLISNTVLAVVAWGSFLVGTPFTEQYAKQQVPQSKWHSPVFIKINQILTMVWGVAFTFSIPYGVSSMTTTILSSFFMVIAVLFTIFFPDWYRFKKMRQKTAESHFLHGNFAPVLDELDVKNLSSTGSIPTDLSGVYLRNGPNPAFPPLSYTYPFDGDGMIHAVYLKKGKAHYRNRFVETEGLKAERRAGKALYGGILNPVIPSKRWFSKRKNKNAEISPFKNGAFIHIIYHAKKFLALWEGGAAYEMNSALRTLGEWQPDTNKSPINVGPHTRFDSSTGELWLINYNIASPYLTVYCVNEKGKLIKEIPVEKKYSTMMHDFAMTQNHLVFMDCPILLDMEALMTGGEVLQWKPELNTRIGLMPRKGGETLWLETEPFFVFHLANAYETENEIIVDYVRYPRFQWINGKTAGDAQKESLIPQLYRTRIDAKTHKISHEMLNDRPVEFPCISKNRNTLSHRFIYAPTKNAADTQTHFHALLKYDTELRKTAIYDFGPYSEIGEAVFTPTEGGKAEDEGYLMLFVYDRKKNSSDFVILNAQNIAEGPIARIHLPRRVPAGLHGSWVEGTSA